MIKFGVVRNGEHLQLWPTKPLAEQHIEALKGNDRECVKIGWLTQKQADTTRYHIERVKGKVW